ncbi:ferritin [Gordonia sp. PS3]|uniref:Ferritin n=1 Tax=Gordonia sihwensis NBRC 108236 TaxID=1223544 RepID=L7LR62_9ACTN|nr:MULTISPECIES: ferritin [Gordonia]AUH67398.1 bacterioferritin [Gordonia sp. YC-JH1]KXT56157.1 bacterioferritin [Gordonia sp. QH-12]MBY4570456.1 bacterioferritin [Gordonia sihwensis]WFN92966.1 ferritin [Gordonia sihwensis]GAC62662.1 ferritin [Gordonia sihwensis NBRC 108236]
MTETPRTPFHQLLHDQISNEFSASQQYIALAVYYDSHDMPQLAKHFYAQSVEERNHAMMIVQYFLDRDIDVKIPAADAPITEFDDYRGPIELALKQEKIVTQQIVDLAKTARDSGDYLGEQFMQWFLKEQVEEVATITTLQTIADRANGNIFDLENFVEREVNNGGPAPDAAEPPAAGGNL